VLAADLLWSLLNVVKDQGLLALPLPLNHCQDFLVLQYVDDTLIFMQGCARQLFFLKVLLNSFTESTGLKVNFTKSMVVPIDVSMTGSIFWLIPLGVLKEVYPSLILGSH